MTLKHTRYTVACRGTPIWKFTDIPITDILAIELPIPLLIPICCSNGLHQGLNMDATIKIYKDGYQNVKL